MDVCSRPWAIEQLFQCCFHFVNTASIWIQIYKCHWSFGRFFFRNCIWCMCLLYGPVALLCLAVMLWQVLCCWNVDIMAVQSYDLVVMSLSSVYNFVLVLLCHLMPQCLYSTCYLLYHFSFCSVSEFMSQTLRGLTSVRTSSTQTNVAFLLMLSISLFASVFFCISCVCY